MSNEQIKLFYSMVCLYDSIEYGMEAERDQIEKLIDSNNYEAIDTLYNENERVCASDLFLDMFPYDIHTLNKMADEFGYMKVSI